MHVVASGHKQIEILTPGPVKMTDWAKMPAASSHYLVLIPGIQEFSSDFFMCTVAGIG